MTVIPLLLLAGLVGSAGWLVLGATGALWRRWFGAPVVPVQQLRRCDACRVGWKAWPGRRTSAVRLRVQRYLRHRRGTRTLPPSWNRCPHCLSTRVRTSSLSARVMARSTGATRAE